MVRLPYATGYRAERRARDELVKQGYYVMRAGGSRGPFDLAAFCRDHVKLIQVKVRGFGQKKKYVKERIALSYVLAPDNVQKELWVWEKRGKWYIYKIPNLYGKIEGKGGGKLAVEI